MALVTPETRREHSREREREREMEGGRESKYCLAD